MTDDEASSAEELSDFPVPDPNWVVESRTTRLREAARRVGGNRALASKSKVPLGTLNGYLAGGEPKLSALSAIADASGLAFEWLALGTGTPDDHASENKEAAAGKIDFVIANPPFPRPTAQSAPRSRFALFATVDVSQLAVAIATAEAAFSAKGGSPTYREKAQAIALIYDMITAQETRNVPGEPAS